VLVDLVLRKRRWEELRAEQLIWLKKKGANSGSRQHAVRHGLRWSRSGMRKDDVGAGAITVLLSEHGAEGSEIASDCPVRGGADALSLINRGNSQLSPSVWLS
jgi:hypothetical protein